MTYVSVCNDFEEIAPLGSWPMYHKGMKNETALPFLTDSEMEALLAASETVFTSVPDGTVSTTSEVRVTVHATPCFLG